MKNVLFYGDSNTWGYQGDDPMHRLDADKRYTGVVAAQFPDVHFIEEGLCGRTICSTDPIDYSRNGMAMLPAPAGNARSARRDRYHARHKRQQGNVRPLTVHHQRCHGPHDQADAKSAFMVKYHAETADSSGCTAENGRKPCRQRLLRHV